MGQGGSNVLFPQYTCAPSSTSFPSSSSSASSSSSGALDMSMTDYLRAAFDSRLTHILNNPTSLADAQPTIERERRVSYGLSQVRGGQEKSQKKNIQIFTIFCISYL